MRYYCLKTPLNKFIKVYHFTLGLVLSQLSKMAAKFEIFSLSIADDLIHSRPVTKEDDIFAFGTLIFEIFGGFLPFPGLPTSEICKEIQRGRIHDQLKNFPGKTEKLKRVIQACWIYQANQRIPLSRLAANFTPGNYLVRRHSTSEPQLDQILNKNKKL